MWHWLFVGLLALVQSPAPKPCERVDGGGRLLSDSQKATLAARYAGWEVRRQCAADYPEYFDGDSAFGSIASGDYDDDGRTDVAVLLESTTKNQTMIIVFMSSVRNGPVSAGEGQAYLSMISRGTRGHDFETERDFTYERDAVFSGKFECCGFSLVWRNGKFVRIASSD